MSVTGATDHLVNVWQLNNQELVLTLNGHSGPVTAVSVAPSGLFVASGSEDKTIKVWGLTLGTLVLTFSVSFYTHRPHRCSNNRIVMLNVLCLLT